MRHLILCLSVLLVFFPVSTGHAQLPDLNIQQNYDNGQKKMEIKTEDGKYIIREYGPDGTLKTETIKSKEELMQEQQRAEEPQILEYKKDAILVPRIGGGGFQIQTYCVHAAPGPGCVPCNKYRHVGWLEEETKRPAISLAEPFPVCSNVTDNCNAHECKIKLKASGYFITGPGREGLRFHAETWSILQE